MSLAKKETTTTMLARLYGSNSIYHLAHSTQSVRDTPVHCRDWERVSQMGTKDAIHLLQITQYTTGWNILWYKYRGYISDHHHPCRHGPSYITSSSPLGGNSIRRKNKKLHRQTAHWLALRRWMDVGKSSEFHSIILKPRDRPPSSFSTLHVIVLTLIATLSSRGTNTPPLPTLGGFYTADPFLFRKAGSLSTDFSGQLINLFSKHDYVSLFL